MNAFNSCSLNYVAIEGKLIEAALLLRAFSHINMTQRCKMLWKTI